MCLPAAFASKIPPKNDRIRINTKEGNNVGGEKRKESLRAREQFLKLLGLSGLNISVSTVSSVCREKLLDLQPTKKR